MAPTTRPEADKTELKNAYEEASKVSNDGYTKESWDAFMVAMANADKVLKDVSASQAEVTAALKQLADAEKALKKATVPTVTVEPQQPTATPELQPTQSPVEPSRKPTPQVTTKPGQKPADQDKGHNGVKVGDDSPIAMMVLLLVAAGSVLAVGIKRKRTGL